MALPPAPAGEATLVTEAKQPTLMPEPIDEQAEQESPFSFFTIAPKFGYLFFPKSSISYNEFEFTVDTRHGFIAKLHLDVGGDGFAFEIAPFFAVQTGGIEPSSGLDLSSGFTGGSYQALGGQLGLAYRLAFGRFFPSFGAGIYADYVMGDQVDYGTEIYGRIPIGLTVYLNQHIGITVELGLMFGVTGIKTPFTIPAELQPVLEDLDGDTLAELEAASSPEDYQQWYFDHQEEVDQIILEHGDELSEQFADYDADQLKEDFIREQFSNSIRFGYGFGLDFTIGLRFP